MNEVLAAAGVPKGSFYYYFTSKEDFGLQVIDNFDRLNKASLKQYLEDECYDPLTRLKLYFQSNIEYLVSLQCRQGCLAGNLGQELADQNDTFRLRVNQVLEAWAESLAGCISQAQKAGQITSDQDARMLGEFCLNSWEGAILKMKVSKSRAPLDNFLHLIFECVLRK